jgi:predicted TIM-barrel fold metal-dependent hydrolase
MNEPGKRRQLIDVHAHYVSPEQAAQRAQQATARNFVTDPSLGWSPEAAVEFMDAHGIGMQLISSPRPLGPEAAQRINDYGAAVVADNPDRFGLLANLPLGTPDEALKEIARAMEELGAAGFIIGSNYDGRLLGDDFFTPVFEELNARRAAILLHPVEPAGFDLVSSGRPGPLIEFPFDTARTVVDALYARLFQRFPDFALILAHGGGALPALSHRVAQIGTRSSMVPGLAGLTGKDIEGQIAGLYYDTAVAGAPTAVAPLLEVTGADHVLFGTDYMPAGIETIEANYAALLSSTLVSPEQLAATTETALRLFPVIRDRFQNVTDVPSTGSRRRDSLAEDVT